ncbi:helix-turn-helix transcriptional regulator [uncultured Paraglaciecola sp.]|uniref:helix-turn-helix domain-containing protein n=1 Tax=uncultured Paraglaciecola sp. TaxID=1765024 RepID=UPI002632452C|nr:helix-turn-helix transcriptional regulator [uncultured Paraglaciecola sp.]
MDFICSLQLLVVKLTTALASLQPAYFLSLLLQTNEKVNLMILADKIIKLRKQLGWSQEELAEKMSVSRQSVSKWESTNSIPDLNKIIVLAGIFGVSTDYLLKDDIEAEEPVSEDSEPGVNQINLEQALLYVENKVKVSDLIAKGVMFCVCSVIPLFFLMMLNTANKLPISNHAAIAIGIVSIMVMIVFGISYFIKINQYDNELAPIDNQRFELAYGVHGVFTEKLQKFMSTYNQRLMISISLFIFCSVPLIVTSILTRSSELTLLMLIVLLFMIAIGIYILMPASTKHDAYHFLLKEGDLNAGKTRTTILAEKLAAVYWPLIIAIYLGWSLWTMQWGVTWIVWPVGAISFVALVGIVSFFDKENER